MEDFLLCAQIVIFGAICFFAGLTFVVAFMQQVIRTLSKVELKTEGQTLKAIWTVKEGISRVLKPLLRFGNTIYFVVLLSFILLLLDTRNADISWRSSALCAVGIACCSLFFALLFSTANRVLFHAEAISFIDGETTFSEEGKEINYEGWTSYLFNAFLKSTTMVMVRIAAGFAALGLLITALPILL